VTSLYPSPAAGPVTLVIESDAPAIASIQVYNVAGQLVLSSREALGTGRSSVTVDGGGRLGSGVYFVRVEARGHVARRKFHIVR
jgi:hypothetical protein